MKLSLQIERKDIKKVRTFLVAHQDDAFVKHRVAKNLGRNKPQITKRAFWERMVACLLTTQQRSGPKSAVTRFINTRPFPLRYRLFAPGKALTGGYVTSPACQRTGD